MIKNKLIWLLVACLPLLGLLLLGCGSDEGQAQAEPDKPQEQRINVTIREVRPTPIKDVLILPGETQPWQDVSLAADQGGRVEWIGPQEGDRIKKGDLLAKIDVSALKAALDNAQAAHRLSRNLYDRRKNLYDRKIISREELDTARTDVEVKLGSVRQAKVQYEHGFLHSPIDGVVNRLHVDPGEYVRQGEPVADLVNVEKIKIEVNVPELDVRFLKVGQQAMVRVDAFKEHTYIGTVEFVAMKADPATKTFRVKVVIENTEGRVRPGMIARLAFLRQVIPDALVAPLFALVDKGGERLVFVEKDGVVQARTVSLGVIEGDVIQITEGLEEGDHLIVTGQTEIEDGTKVQVQ